MLNPAFTEAVPLSIPLLTSQLHVSLIYHRFESARVAPEWQAFPACPPISLSPGCHFGRWRVPTSSEKALDDFLAGLTAWERKVLRWDYASLTPEEWLEHNLQQDEVFQLRAAYEQLLSGFPPQLKEYRRAQQSYVNATMRIEAKLILPTVPPGRPTKNVLANEASRLRDTGLSYAKIATRLNQAGGLRPADADYATEGSIRKLLKRHKAPMKTTPDKTKI